MESKHLKKVVSGVLIGGMILTLGTISLAATPDTNSSVSGKKISQGYERAFKGGNLERGFGSKATKEDKGVVVEDALNALREEGVITADQITKYQAYVEKTEVEREKVTNNSQNKRGFGQNNFEKRGNLCLSDDQDIFTDDQVDAIREKMQDLNQKSREEAVSSALDTLVSENTITADQKTKFIEYMEVNQTQREAEMAKIEDMKVSEAREYMRTSKDNIVNPLTKLVEDKVITQDQADAISKVIPLGGLREKGGHGGGMRGMFR